MLTNGFDGGAIPLGMFSFLLRRVMALLPQTTPLWNEESGEEEKEREEINRRAEELLGRYGNSILRFAYSYLHNMEDAEEILQETMLQFLWKRPRFENETHAKAWLLRVAGNRSKNKLAYIRTRAADPLREELVAEQQEDLSFVWEAVKALPIRYREVIHLFYCEGYSTAEIAAILHRKESTVRPHLSRGRERLKGILKEEYHIEGDV